MRWPQEEVDNGHHGNDGEQQQQEEEEGTGADHDAAQGQSASGTTLGSGFNIINSAVGAGILALPHAFQQAGLVGGALILVTGAVVETLCLFILIAAADKRKASSYQGLVKSTLGSTAQSLIAVACILYLFGACVGYLIVVGDTLTPILHAHVVHHLKETALRKICIALVSATICFPLSLSKRLSALEAISGVVPVAVIYVVGLVLYRGAQALDAPPSLYIGPHPFLSIPVIVLAFQCHIQIVPIFAELGVAAPRREKKGRRNQEELGLLLPEQGDNPSALTLRKLKRRAMTTSTVCSVVFCFLLYGAIGTFGYLQFGDEIKSNIISNYKHGSASIDIARIGIAITAIVSYPVNLFPARSAILDIVQPLFPMTSSQQQSTKRSWLAPIVTLWFYVGTVSIALYVDDLGIVYEIVGATVGVTVIFIIPGILLAKGHASSRKETRYMTHKLAGWALVGIGCLITATSVLSFASVV